MRICFPRACSRKCRFLLLVILCMVLFVLTWSSFFSEIDNSPMKRNFAYFYEQKPKQAQYLITRILSNDLTPLHGESQTLINTQLILKHEVLPENFGRLWVFHSLVSNDKFNQIYLLLISHGEWVEILDLPRSKNVTVLQTAAFNINKGRNFALAHAFKSEAEWVFLYDGCSFFPKESFDALTRVVSKPNFYLMHYTPMVRLQYKIDLSMDLTYEDIFPYISGQQECQIAISRFYYENRQKIDVFKDQSELFFSEDRTYGNQDKLGLMRYFDHSLSNDSISCKEAFVGYAKEKSESASLDLDLISNCGYMIRLLYHPERGAPANQSLSAVERGALRYESMLEFTKSLVRKSGGDTSKDVPTFKFSK